MSLWYEWAYCSNCKFIRIIILISVKATLRMLLLHIIKYQTEGKNLQLYEMNCIVLDHLNIFFSMTQLQAFLCYCNVFWILKIMQIAFLVIMGVLQWIMWSVFIYIISLHIRLIPFLVILSVLCLMCSVTLVWCFEWWRFHILCHLVK